MIVKTIIYWIIIPSAIILTAGCEPTGETMVQSTRARTPPATTGELYSSETRHKQVTASEVISEPYTVVTASNSSEDQIDNIITIPSESTLNLTQECAHSQLQDFLIAFVIWPGDGRKQGIWLYSSEKNSAVPLLETEPGTFIKPRIALNPDETAIGYTRIESDDRWAVWEIDVDSAENRMLTPLFPAFKDGDLERWLPDDQWLFISYIDYSSPIGSDHQIISNIRTEKTREIGQTDWLAWSTNEPSMLIKNSKNALDQPVVEVQNLEGVLDQFKTPSNEEATDFWWNADGDRILMRFNNYSNSPPSYYVLNIKSGEWRHIIDTEGYSAGWSEDDRWIAFIDDNRLIFVDMLNNYNISAGYISYDSIIPVGWLNINLFIVHSEDTIYSINVSNNICMNKLLGISDIHPYIDPYTKLLIWSS